MFHGDVPLFGHGGLAYNQNYFGYNLYVYSPGASIATPARFLWPELDHSHPP